MPFPEGSNRDDVDELHGDLAYWDSMVAEAVIPMTKGVPYDEGVLDLADGVQDLLRRIEALGSTADDADRDLLGSYANYSRSLAAVVIAARRHAKK